MNPIADTRFYKGIEQFNNRDFFDCHDTLEEIWMENYGEERRFLQGLVQVAVAYYHCGNGNLKGAESMLNKAIPKLEVYPETYYGIDLSALLATIRLHRTIFENANLRKSDSHSVRELDAPTIQYQIHI